MIDEQNRWNKQNKQQEIKQIIYTKSVQIN